MENRRERSDALRRAAVDELRRRADAITSRILYSDEPWVDIEIAIGRLREHVERRFPGQQWLFERIYEARWARLHDQGWARTRSPW